MTLLVKTFPSFCRSTFSNYVCNTVWNVSDITCTHLSLIIPRSSAAGTLHGYTRGMCSVVDGSEAGSSKQHCPSHSSLSVDGDFYEQFNPRNALVLTKFSRYEFEKRRRPDLTEEQLAKNLKDRGSDYKGLLHHHNIHTCNRDQVVKILQQNGIETKVVNRFDYTDANIEWADVIFTTGGDGTFLMAASKVLTRDKPIIGINSDPSRFPAQLFSKSDDGHGAWPKEASYSSSVGYLCLPSKYTTNFEAAFVKLKQGKFRWTYRQRIRVTLIGEQAYETPIELHDQQLKYPEYRFLDCTEGQQKKPEKVSGDPEFGTRFRHVLPVRALNEVFIGESLSSRVSYYELSIDGVYRGKLKSSGLTVCTGTGSTSWSFNINKVTPQCVQQILQIVNDETDTKLPVADSQLVERITSKFNNSLIFEPTKPLMAYTIRDPVVFGTGFNSMTRGFAHRMELKSRMFDACLVIDGGLSFVFNDGATAILEIYDEDALRTVTLIE